MFSLSSSSVLILATFLGSLLACPSGLYALPTGRYAPVAVRSVTTNVPTFVESRNTKPAREMTVHLSPRRTDDSISEVKARDSDSLERRDLSGMGMITSGSSVVTRQIAAEVADLMERRGLENEAPPERRMPRRFEDDCRHRGGTPRFVNKRGEDDLFNGEPRCDMNPPPRRGVITHEGGRTARRRSILQRRRRMQGSWSNELS